MDFENQPEAAQRQPEFSQNEEARMLQERLLDQHNRRMNTMEQARLDAIARLAVDDSKHGQGAKSAQAKAAFPERMRDRPLRNNNEANANANNDNDDYYENVKFVNTLKNKKKKKLEDMFGDRPLVKARKEIQADLDRRFQDKLDQLRKTYESKIDSYRQKMESNRVLNRTKDQNIVKMTRKLQRMERKISDLEQSKLHLVESTAKAMDSLRTDIKWLASPQYRHYKTL